MARLVNRTDAGRRKVYDVTVAETHSFFAYSRHGNQDHAILAHNCHELSRQAMDALLKPLEDNRRGSNEKQIVCIFCTTEPERMRPAILSRCAPLFRIRLNTPEEIGQRLVHICASEEIDSDPEVLPLIAEVTECHVRDAIQALEGVSMLGRVDRDNVAQYLHLDANALYLDLLEKLGSDLPGLLSTIERLNEKVSPATCYGRMADVCMLAYRLVNLGEAAVPSYWDRERLRNAGKAHQGFLIEFAQRFAQRPVRATFAMFACDVSALHQERAGIVVRAAPAEVVVQTPAPTPSAAPTPNPPPSPPPSAATPEGASEEPETPPIEESPSTETEPSREKPAASVGSMRAEPYLTETGVGINPLAQNTHRVYETRPKSSDEPMSPMSTDEFVKILKRRVLELTEEHVSCGRPARRHDLGGP